MRRILVGLDGSERAREVLGYALEVGGRYGARLRILRVVPWPGELPQEALGVEPERLSRLLLTEAQQALEALVAQVPPDRLESTQVRLGTPWHVLCDAAREGGAELIIIGTHGFRSVDRVAGGTAGRVVSYAPCSVLVVRDGDPAAAGGMA
jgi:nucleotide-binding universal stress UspA family protein